MSAPPRDGLVLELLFNGNASDTSGRGHAVAVHGAMPAEDRFGRANSAYSFDGIDDYLSVDPPPRLNNTALTVSAWVRPDGIDRDGWSSAVVCQDDGNDEDQSRRVFQLSVFRGRAVWHLMCGAQDPSAKRLLPVGAWTHLTAVFEQATHRLYVNGTLAGSVPHRLRAHSEQPLHIGRKGTDEPFFFFRGAIDDIRVYNRALTAGDVSALFREDGFTLPAPPRAAPPISGAWETDDGNCLDIRFDGQRAITGTITLGGRHNVVAISRGSFDPATNELIAEGTAVHPWHRAAVPFRIDGRLQNGTLAVHGRIGNDEASATLRRMTRMRRLGRHVRRLLERDVLGLGRLLTPIVRARRAKLRHSKDQNLRALRERGESYVSFVFRDAVAADIPALAALHVKTWAMTYPEVKRPPTMAIREWQWREAFDKNDGTWFCVVIENATRELIGFAKGIVRADGSGDLNKIYLLWEYHRLGLGRRLVGHVVRRFLSRGVTSMTLSADAANPSCAFYEAIGGEVQRDDHGKLRHGAYVWRDLPTVAGRCPEN